MAHEYAPIPPRNFSLKPERMIPEVPYEVKENFAFLVDDLLESKNPIVEKLGGKVLGPLKETNFRITRSKLDMLEDLLGGDVVRPLRRTIVENRWRCLFSTATKIAGQVGTTAVLTSPDPSLPGFAAGIGTTVLGFAWEGDDRRQTYDEVLDPAYKAMERLFHNHSADLYNWSDVEKDTFIHDTADAIARGESMARPQLAALTAGLLNLIALYGGDQKILAGALALSEVGIIHEQGDIFKKAENARTNQLRRRNTISATMKADRLGGDSDLERNLLNIPPDKRSSWERIWERSITVLRHAAIQGGVPIYAVFNKLGPLALNLAAQLASQWVSAYGNRIFYAQTRAGLSRLDKALAEINYNDVSLIPPKKQTDYCRAFVAARSEENTQNLEARLEAEFPDAVAYIAPFNLTFKGKNKPTLDIKKPLILNPGIYILSAASGTGESLFLKTVSCEVKKSWEETESFIKVRDEDGILKWRRLHDLSPESIKKLFASTTPEPEKMDISPAAFFFGNNLRILVPQAAPNNRYVHELLQRYHAGGNLDRAEKHAISVCLRYLSGLLPLSITSIYSLKISAREKWVLRQLLPSFVPALASENLIGHLSDYNRKENAFLFTEEDFASIRKATTWAEFDRATRSKIRIIKAIETAQRYGASVVTIDETFDPLGEYPEDFLEHISKWSLENQVAILMTTEKPKIRAQFLESSPKRSFRRKAFRDRIFIRENTEKKKT